MKIRRVSKRDVICSWIKQESDVYDDIQLRNIAHNSQIGAIDNINSASDWELFDFLEKLTHGPARLFWMYEPTNWYFVEDIDKDVFIELEAIGSARDWGWGEISGEDGKLRTVAEKLYSGTNVQSNSEIDGRYIRNLYEKDEWPINSPLISVRKTKNPTVFEGNHRTTASIMKILYDDKWEETNLFVGVPHFYRTQISENENQKT